MAKYVRLYTGPDGHTHFEDLSPTFAATGGPATGFRNEIRTGAKVGLVKTVGGAPDTMHNAAKGVYGIVLEGVLEIEVHGGHVRAFHAGDVLLLDEDKHGSGHISRTPAGSSRVILSVALA